MSINNSTIIILIAENNQAVLENYQEYLSTLGYSIITATTANRTRTLLDSGKVDVALIDWRLENDQDANDQSGLEIVRDYGNAMPTILMSLPNRDSESVRRAFLPNLDEAAPVDFFIKEEHELAHLAVAVQRILAKRKIFVVHGHNSDSRSGVKR